LAERFCIIDDMYKELFVKAFINHYNSIFKQEANKIRNLGKLYGHLFYRHAIDWKIFQIITLTPEATTAAGRMFLKILFN
jgi:pre-mRNA-splicing factor CWC22